MSFLLGVLIVAALDAVRAVSGSEPLKSLLMTPIYGGRVVRMGQQMPWMGSAIIILKTLSDVSNQVCYGLRNGLSEKSRKHLMYIHSGSRLQVEDRIIHKDARDAF